MATNIHPGGRRRNRWSIAIWGAAAALLLLPAIAMRVGAEGVHWTASDFVVMGVLLASACGAYELATRLSRDTVQRAGFAAAVLGAFFLVWVNLAVGLVGEGGTPANVMFMGVPGVAIVGTLIARFRAPGMVRAMLVTAGVHGLVGLTAAIAGWGRPYDDVLHVLGVTGFFMVPWLVSAGLFRVSALRHARLAG